MENRIKLLREKRGIRQEALGKEVGVSQQTISRIENDKYSIPLDLLIRIADYFSVSLDYLVGLSNQRWTLESLASANNDFESYIDFVGLVKELNNTNQETILFMIQRLRDTQSVLVERNAGDP